MDSKLWKKVFWIGAFLIVLGGAWVFGRLDFRDVNLLVSDIDRLLVEVRVGGSVIVVEVADSAEERAKGLSGRESLAEGRGMLFLFDPSTSSGQAQPAVQGFWMKEMKFPIDIIWVSTRGGQAGGEVIGFEEYVPAPAAGVPDSELPVYLSPGAVDMVLEVGAGEVERLKIQVGDKFEVVI